MVRIRLFRNTNNKILKWNIIHVQNMVWYTELACAIYRSEKKHLQKYQELKFFVQNIPLLYNLQYQYCPKIEDGPE